LSIENSQEGTKGCSLRFTFTFTGLTAVNLVNVIVTVNDEWLAEL